MRSPEQVRRRFSTWRLLMMGCLGAPSNLPKLSKRWLRLLWKTRLSLLLGWNSEAAGLRRTRLVCIW